MAFVGMGILQNLMRHLRGFVAWLRGIIGMYFLRIRRNFFFHLAVPIDRSIFFFIKALAYGFPARKSFVVGILQADGTALISQHLRHILQESGRMVGSYLVDGSKIGDTVLRQDSRQTTNVRLFEFLRLSRRKRSDVVLIEVTLDDLPRQVYLYINFDAIIFTQFVDEDASPVRTGASRPADGNIASPSAMSILTADGSWRRSNGVNKAEKSVTRDVQSAVDVFLEYVAFQRRKFGVAKLLILTRSPPPRARCASSPSAELRRSVATCSRSRMAPMATSSSLTPGSSSSRKTAAPALTTSCRTRDTSRSTPAVSRASSLLTATPTISAVSPSSCRASARRLSIPRS